MNCKMCKNYVGNNECLLKGRIKDLDQTCEFIEYA